MLNTIALSLLLIFTRAHYSIDIFGGFLFGHYFWIMSERICWVIDYMLMRIPFHKRFPYFPKKCFNCKNSINEWAHADCEERIKEMEGGIECNGKDTEEKNEFMYKRVDHNI